MYLHWALAASQRTAASRAAFRAADGGGQLGRGAAAALPAGWAATGLAAASLDLILLDVGGAARRTARGGLRGAVLGRARETAGGAAGRSALELLSALLGHLDDRQVLVSGFFLDQSEKR